MGDLWTPAAHNGVEPAYLWVPPSAVPVSESAIEAAEFAAAVDIVLDPEQRLALDVVLAENELGKWAAFESSVIAARQNLKTFVFLVIALADLFVFGSELIVWTAHEFNTTLEAFRSAKLIVNSFDWMRKKVLHIHEANGDEGIELKPSPGCPDGQRLRFRARTKSAGRGLTGDRVFLDEAFALTAAMLGSLMPTMAAKSMTGNPQLVYGSSAGKADSHMLRSLRDRGRAGCDDPVSGDPALSWVEWCAPTGGCELDARVIDVESRDITDETDDNEPTSTSVRRKCDHRFGTPGCALDDRRKWRLANPAMNRRISEDYIAAERRSLPPVEFARERLGWWEDPDTAAAGLALDAWGDCKDRASQVETEKALAYDVAHDSSWSAIGILGLRDDGVPHVEVIDYRPGTEWLAQRLAELRTKYGVDVFYAAKSPAEAISTEVADACGGDEPTGLSPSEFAMACKFLEDAVLRRAVHHIGQPELDVSVRGAARRDVADAWAWSRRASSVEIAPLVAITVAFGTLRIRPKKKKKPRVHRWPGEEETSDED